MSPRPRLRANDPSLAVGMGLALAELHRLHGDSSGVCEVAKAAGLTLGELRAVGLDPYDLDELVRAGLPEGERRQEPEGVVMDLRMYRKLRDPELRGRVGRLTREVENKGGMVVPEGTIVTIDGKKRGGLALTLPECRTCGLRFRVVGIDPTAIELLPVGTLAPGPTSEGRAHWTTRSGD